MTDRELLEQAAKAAKQRGRYVENHRVSDEVGIHYLTGMLESKNDESVWNPITDDGDAFRLMVQLGFEVETDYNSRSRVTGDGVGAEEPHGPDPLAATRLAIVKTAAEIGRRAWTEGGKVAE